jgi:hypothetical protein
VAGALLLYNYCGTSKRVCTIALYMIGLACWLDYELVCIYPMALLLWLKWCNDDQIMFIHDPEMIFLFEGFRDMMLTGFPFLIG